MKHILKFSSVEAREYFEKNTQGKNHTKVSDLEVEISIADEMEKEETEETCSKEFLYQTLDQALTSTYNYIRYQNEYLMAEINYLWQSFSKHQEGHLPAVKSSEQMARVIDKLGLDKEYEVAKKVIYAKNEIGDLTVSLLKDEKKS